jgi:hypothetical protein
MGRKIPSASKFRCAFLDCQLPIVITDPAALTTHRCPSCGRWSFLAHVAGSTHEPVLELQCASEATAARAEDLALRIQELGRRHLRGEDIDPVDPLGLQGESDG